MGAFQRQLETYAAVSTKVTAEAVTKKAKDTAMWAAKLTPKLSQGAIKADLHRDAHLLAALTSLSLKKRGKGILGKGKFREEMKALEAGRKAGAAYMVAGWGPAIEQLGGKWIKGKKGTHGGASAKMVHSYGKKATGRDPVALIVWITDQDTDRKREGAEKVAGKALEAAIDYQIKDMDTYINRKLSEVWE